MVVVVAVVNVEMCLIIMMGDAVKLSSAYAH